MWTPDDGAPKIEDASCGLHERHVDDCAACIAVWESRWLHWQDAAPLIQQDEEEIVVTLFAIAEALHVLSRSVEAIAERLVPADARKDEER